MTACKEYPTNKKEKRTKFVVEINISDRDAVKSITKHLRKMQYESGWFCWADELAEIIERG